MAELAYMVREDWAQRGTGMLKHSARIREWLGDDRFALLVADASKYHSDRAADRETAKYIGLVNQRVGPASISDLGKKRGEPLRAITALVIHPYLESDLDVLRRAVNDGVVGRMFVMVWSPKEVVRLWLDALGALNLHNEASHALPNAVMIEASRIMVDEEYNSLESGHGKDAVVGLMRAFRSAGYPSDEKSWARAFVAAGGSFRGLKSVQRFAIEIQGGTRHRVASRFPNEIVRILEQQVEPADA